MNSTTYQPENYSYYIRNGDTIKNYINFSKGGNGRKYVWRAEYKLKKYRLKVYFTAINRDDNTFTHDILEIHCGTGGSSGGGGGGGGGTGANAHPIPIIE